MMQISGITITATDVLYTRPAALKILFEGMDGTVTGYTIVLALKIAFEGREMSGGLLTQRLGQINPLVGEIAKVQLGA